MRALGFADLIASQKCRERSVRGCFETSMDVDRLASMVEKVAGKVSRRSGGTCEGKIDKSVEILRIQRG
jgi:hypothetical protein